MQIPRFSNFHVCDTTGHCFIMICNKLVDVNHTSNLFVNPARPYSVYFYFCSSGCLSSNVGETQLNRQTDLVLTGSLDLQHSNFRSLWILPLPPRSVQ